jgi:hypothetical protein
LAENESIGIKTLRKKRDHYEELSEFFNKQHNPKLARYYQLKANQLKIQLEILE